MFVSFMRKNWEHNTIKIVAFARIFPFPMLLFSIQTVPCFFLCRSKELKSVRAYSPNYQYHCWLKYNALCVSVSVYSSIRNDMKFFLCICLRVCLYVVFLPFRRQCLIFLLSWKKRAQQLTCVILFRLYSQSTGWNAVCPCANIKLFDRRTYKIIPYWHYINVPWW